MKIIVTGNSGFLGGAMADKLHSEGHEVWGISRRRVIMKDYFTLNLDLSDLDIEFYRPYIAGLNPNIIYHFAGNPLVKVNDSRCSTDNILTTHNLLDCTPSNCKFVFSSSATVYGRGNKYGDERPDSIYGLSKLHCEKLISQYWTDKKIKDFAIYRLVAHAGGTHGLIVDIINKLKNNEEYLTLLGNEPGSCKPFLNIEDTVNIIYNSSVLNNDFGIHNISPQDNLTVKEVANIIMNELDIHKDIKWLGDAANWSGDTKYVSVHCKFPKIRNSEQAIRDYVKSIK